MIFLQPDPIHMNSPSPLSDAFWSDLLKALRAQQCVLFIGPDALPDLPLFEALCRYLGGDLTADPPRPPEDVLAVYPNEELFLFSNTGDRAALSFRLDDFYREQEKRLAPVYRQIAALPLPLVAYETRWGSAPRCPMPTSCRRSQQFRSCRTHDALLHRRPCRSSSPLAVGGPS